MNQLQDIIDSEHFQASVGPALVVLVVALALGVLWRRRRDHRLPVGGLLFAVAGYVALRDGLEVSNALPLGLALLAVAGLTGDLVHWPLLARAALAVPGAVVVGFATDVSDLRWVQVAVALTAVVGGAAAADFDRRWRRPSIGCGMLAVAVAGVYGTIPDTEAALCLIAPVAAIAVVAWPGALLRLGSGGAFAAIGLVAWVCAFGGIGRDGSIVGGMASLGLLVAEPLAAWFAGVHGALVRHPTWRSAVGMAAGQTVVVYLTARVAGFRRAVTPATLLAVLTLLVAAVACVAVSQLTRRGRQSTDVSGGSAVAR